MIDFTCCIKILSDSGDYRETLTKLSDGTKTSIRGDYLTIYKRGAGGTWLIVQQVWTEVGAPPPNPDQN